MERLTTNKDVSKMGMFELAHNFCYIKDGKARYRDHTSDMDARELTRELLKKYADGDDAFIDDGDFDEWMVDYLQYGFDSMEGLLALFYRNLWAMADLRERLKQYEDTDEEGKILKLPCKVGDMVYTNVSMKGWYFRKKNRPYEARVVFIGINGVDNFINVDFGNGRMLQFKFSDIGKIVFLNQEEAAEKLKAAENQGSF